MFVNIFGVTQEIPNRNCYSNKFWINITPCGTRCSLPNRECHKLPVGRIFKSSLNTHPADFQGAVRRDPKRIYWINVWKLTGEYQGMP